MGVFNRTHQAGRHCGSHHVWNQGLLPYLQVILTAPLEETGMLLLGNCAQMAHSTTWWNILNIVGMWWWGKGRDALHWKAILGNSTSLHLRSSPCQFSSPISSRSDYHVPSSLLSKVPQTCQTVCYLPACVQQLSLPRMPSPKPLCSHILWAGVSCMLQSLTLQVQIPAFWPTSCMTVENLFNFSRTQLTQLKDGHSNNITYAKD